jgi:hypothetical protein
MVGGARWIRCGEQFWSPHRIRHDMNLADLRQLVARFGFVRTNGDVTGGSALLMRRRHRDPSLRTLHCVLDLADKNRPTWHLHDEEQGEINGGPPSRPKDTRCTNSSLNETDSLGPSRSVPPPVGVPICGTVITHFYRRSG